MGAIATKTAFSGVGNAVVEVLAKRVLRGKEQYLVLTPAYEVSWKPTATLLPEYSVLIEAYKNATRRENS
ncbi:hypothetical protein GQ600_14054 [Phytophthora cactorum]|nr:hypothetical protein GQ600_14054 [Phytophthora cactorum]